MSNLLEETKEILENHNKTIEDIKWIGTSKHYVDINKFIELADSIYDDGYGVQEVADNLLIVGTNWWLERHEYDGSEWWEYKTIPQKPKKFLELKSLYADIGWESLERINLGDKENDNNVD